jgi:hypothetical protein
MWNQISPSLSQQSPGNLESKGIKILNILHNSFRILSGIVKQVEGEHISAKQVLTLSLVQQTGMLICGLLQGAYVNEGLNICDSLIRINCRISTGPFLEDDLLLWLLQADANLTFKLLEQGNHFLNEPSCFI